MDQPEGADPTTYSAGSEILQSVPDRERSTVAGKKKMLIKIIFYSNNDRIIAENKNKPVTLLDLL